MPSSYFLDQKNYSLRNALCWGNSWGHLQKAYDSHFDMRTRICHFVVALAELPPIFGQIVSFFEAFLAHIHYTLKNSEIAKLENRKIKDLSNSKKDLSNSKIDNNGDIKITTVNMKVEKSIDNKITKGDLDKVQNNSEMIDTFLSAENKRQFLDDLLKNDPEKLKIFLTDWIKKLELLHNRSPFQALQLKYGKIDWFNLIKEIKPSLVFENEQIAFDQDNLHEVAIFILQNLKAIHSLSKTNPIITLANVVNIMLIKISHHTAEGYDTPRALIFKTLIFDSFLSKSRCQGISNTENLKYFFEFFGEEAVHLFNSKNILADLFDRNEDLILFALGILIECSQDCCIKTARAFFEKFLTNSISTSKTLVEWIFTHLNNDQLKIFLRGDVYEKHTLLTLLLVCLDFDSFKLIRDNPIYRKHFTEFTLFDANSPSQDRFSLLDKLLILVQGKKQNLEMNDLSNIVVIFSDIVTNFDVNDSQPRLIEPLFLSSSYPNPISELLEIGENNFELLKKILLQPVSKILDHDRNRKVLWPHYPNAVQWILNTQCEKLKDREDLKKLIKLLYTNDPKLLIDCLKQPDPANHHWNALTRVLVNEMFDFSYYNKNDPLISEPLYYNSDWIEWFEEFPEQIRVEKIEKFFENFTREMSQKLIHLIEAQKEELNQCIKDFKEGQKSSQDYQKIKNELKLQIKTQFFKFMQDSFDLKITDWSDYFVDQTDLSKKLLEEIGTKSIMKNIAFQVENGLEDSDIQTFVESITEELTDTSNEVFIAFENDLKLKYGKAQIQNSTKENLIQILLESSFGENDLTHIQSAPFSDNYARKYTPISPLFIKTCDLLNGKLYLDKLFTGKIYELLDNETIASANITTVSLSRLVISSVTISNAEKKSISIADLIKKLFEVYPDIGTIEIHRWDLEKEVSVALEEIFKTRDKILNIRILDNPFTQELIKTTLFNDFTLEIGGVEYQYNLPFLRSFGLADEAEKWKKTSEDPSIALSNEVAEWKDFTRRVNLAYSGQIELSVSNLDWFKNYRGTIAIGWRNRGLLETAENVENDLKYINSILNGNLLPHLYTKNEYFKNLITYNFENFKIEDEEWFSRVIQNEEVLRAVFIYLCEHHVDIKTEKAALELYEIARYWNDEELVRLLYLECARLRREGGSIECNKYICKSQDMRDEETRNNLFKFIREGFENNSFGIYKIQFRDKIGESNNEADIKINGLRFQISVIKNFGLNTDYEELMRLMDKHANKVICWYPDEEFSELQRKYCQAHDKNIIEITPQNIDEMQNFLKNKK